MNNPYDYVTRDPSSSIMSYVVATIGQAFALAMPYLRSGYKLLSGQDKVHIGPVETNNWMKIPDSFRGVYKTYREHQLLSVDLAEKTVWLSSNPVKSRCLIIDMRETEGFNPVTYDLRWNDIRAGEIWECEDGTLGVTLREKGDVSMALLLNKFPTGMYAIKAHDSMYPHLSRLLRKRFRVIDTTGNYVDRVLVGSKIATDLPF